MLTVSDLGLTVFVQPVQLSCLSYCAREIVEFVACRCSTVQLSVLLWHSLFLLVSFKTRRTFSVTVENAAPMPKLQSHAHMETTAVWERRRWCGCCVAG